MGKARSQDQQGRESPETGWQAVPDEPRRGAIGDLRALQQSGLQTFRRFVRGELPGPPIWRLTGMKPTEVTLGKATFSMPVTTWLADGSGIYWGGICALLADAPLASAIWTTLPAGKVLSTSELTISFVRPITNATRNLVGRAETVHSGRQVGLSMVEITDQDGRLLAFGSSRCMITDLSVDPDEDLPEPDLGPDDTPDPYRRDPPDAELCDLKEFAELKPLELQQATIAEGRTQPIWQLTGYRPREVEEGCFHGTLPTSEWFSNGSLAIYGGMLAWAADFTMGAAIYSTLPAGDLFATLDMHIRFTRPAKINSGDLTCIAQVRHYGRQLRVVTCNIDTADGKRVAMATASALVIKGAARDLAEGGDPEEIIAQADHSAGHHGNFSR
ncbi:MULTISPECIES: PaaI family thioesterase [Microbulbifer]|uniref:PaaI family thioesterase n=1 Tax=Microbulbifer TaxID=48073 RepID=UPI001E5F42F3|nr:MULTISPECIES: PaaI family thioesterase [Microbulbifer]UHQ55227.1 PaaI family thioesterase [Microbulbifer sp. YPW16]